MASSPFRQVSRGIEIRKKTFAPGCAPAQGKVGANRYRFGSAICILPHLTDTDKGNVLAF